MWRAWKSWNTYEERATQTDLTARRVSSNAPLAASSVTRQWQVTGDADRPTRRPNLRSARLCQPSADCKDEWTKMSVTGVADGGSGRAV